MKTHPKVSSTSKYLAGGEGEGGGQIVCWKCLELRNDFLTETIPNGRRGDIRRCFLSLGHDFDQFYCDVSYGVVVDWSVVSPSLFVLPSLGRVSFQPRMPVVPLSFGGVISTGNFGVYLTMPIVAAGHDVVTIFY